MDSFSHEDRGLHEAAKTPLPPQGKSFGTPDGRMPSRVQLGLFLLCLSLAIVLFAHWNTGYPRQEGRDPMVPARLAARGEPIPLLVKCREQPLRVLPNPGLGNVVNEEDMVTVLCAALPWWNPPSVPSAFHELKLWGRNAVFTKEMLGVPRTGEFLVETLLSDKLCRANTVSVGGAYLLDSPFGIRPVLMGTEDALDYRAEAHYGQLLLLLGEVGTPPETQVTSSSGRVGTVAQLYQDAVLRFSLAQELEFIGCALAYWHPPQKGWKDQFGNEYTFDDLLSRLIATPLGQGSCGGCHVPYTIVTILRVDEDHPILSSDVRRKARKWLAVLAQLLELRCSSSGGWDGTWATNGPRSFIMGDDLLDRITVTGHHLEWIALAPDGIRPSEAAVERAVLALRRDVESLPPLARQPFKTLLPVSHGARALALLRGDDPYSAWLKYWKNGRLKRSKRGFDICNSSP